jgi:hypothetical protein
MVKRDAPGLFSEQVTAAIAEGVKIPGFDTRTKSLELEDNPFTEELTITLEAKRESGTMWVEFVYTFTNESSVEENLQRVRHFVQHNWDTASSVPVVERPHSIKIGTGD